MFQLSDEIQKALEDWKKSFYATVKLWKCKESCDIFAAFYTFKPIVMMLDREIDTKLQKNECLSIPFSGEIVDRKITLNIPNVLFLPYHNFFMKEWSNLDNIFLDSSMQKQMNVTYEEYMELRYTNYFGFISRFFKNDGTVRENVYFTEN